MSHEATNWAFSQPERFTDMKPAEWAVLMVLANCHNPVNGCFPSQDYLSRKTNQDQRSVRRQLKKLHGRDLVNWDEAREGGKRGSNRYILAFESDFTAQSGAEKERENPPEIQPDKLSGRAVSTGQNEPFQPDKIDRFNRTNCPPKEVRESVSESLGAKTREKEDADLKKREKAIERAFKEFAPQWPTWVHDSEPAARKAWFGLSDDERDEAVARFDDYLEASKTGGRTQVCSLGRYLSERKWQKLGEVKRSDDQPLILKPFGKGWMAHRLQLLARPRDVWRPTGYQQRMIDAGKAHLFTRERRRGEFRLVAMLDDNGAQGRNCHLRPGTALPDVAAYVAVEQGSAQWAAWAAWHEQNDYPFIKPPKYRSHVWFPAEIPPATAAAETEDELAHG